ncbi:MAG: DEAD/DEAH box helicase [candidate division WOR-3 bacterium]|nr:MAG: DEAD/DEAH box helicase [candidate division WOR-3 bacterium]
MDSTEIKDRLKRTWVPFFSRFGNFTPIQELSIPRILKGENVVVISPAATGKTEAVIAPVLENMIQKGHVQAEINSIKVLYISPTRALVNDLYRRLVDPISYLDILLGRKTGDRPKIDHRKLPHVLLTTPESFDSLIARQTRIFLDLEAVVLDEIHLLDNTPRGDQLRVLLSRLRRIKKGIQYCALSATIDDLNIGLRYFNDPKVCFLKSQREIECKLISQRDFVRELFHIIQERRLKKILIFFNARSYAEAFSQKLNRPPFQDAVLVHHASLPKERREEVERQMNNSNRAILCATSTLELGIDIGDIDCIILYRPPFNVSSLLQRTGRGNRRTNTLFALGVYTTNWEKILFEAFFQCAQQGQLFERRYRPSLSVIPQQLYSYLYQRRRIGTTLKSLYNILTPIFDEELVKIVFKKLIDEGIVKEVRPRIYFVSDRLEKKIDWGKIHSNIAETSFGEYDVFDVTSGSFIGRIFYLQEQFILGGKCWQIVQMSEREKKVYAKFIGHASKVAKIFEGKGAGNYDYLLSTILKKKIFPEMAIKEFPCTFDGTNTYIVHLLGSLYGFILADALSVEGIDAVDVEGKLLVLNRFRLDQESFPVPRHDTIKKVIGKNIRRLEDALGSGAYFYDLPTHYQVEDHYMALDIEGFLEFLCSMKMLNLELGLFRNAVKSLTQKD